MIDLHSHILPAVDDGACDLAESITMLEMAIETGVETQVLTPHFYPIDGPGALARFAAAFSQLAERVQELELPIELHLSSEVQLSPDILEFTNENRLPVLGVCKGKRVVLLEFPHSGVPFGSENLIQWFIEHNYLPLIAHPERVPDFQSNANALDAFVGQGCLLQLTADSLTGRFGKAAFLTSKRLLESGQVTVIATDCHDCRDRKPNLHEGFKAAADLIGATAAERLVKDNPRAILQRPQLVDTKQVTGE